MSDPFLPYGRQSIDDADVAAVVEVLRGDYLTTGPAVDAFEQALVRETGAKYAVSCANGTAALHLAALALGLKAGDTVIVPAVTFLATANAAILTGADVVFADVDPATGLMRAADLEAAIARARSLGKTVQAVFNVHLAGQCENLEDIARVADMAGARMVDDAAHAIGGAWRDTRVGDGRYSTMTTMSFHPVKTITAGEGGAVTTNDDGLHRRLKRMRNHGMIREPDQFVDRAAGFDGDAPNPWYYEMHEPGLNYRLSDIHAALARSQLDKIDCFVACRRDLVRAYDERIAGLAPRVRALGRVADSRPAWHLYVGLIDFAACGRSRAIVTRALHARGIGTQVHYIPLPFQPYYRARERGTDYPGAQSYYDRCLSLPLHPAMTRADVDRVMDELTKALRL